MAPPTHYNRIFSFTNYSTLNPTTPPPGNQIDAELNAILTAVNQTMDSLALVQNSDSTLGNLTVGPNQLSSQLTTGFTPPSIWSTGVAYTASPASCVLNGSAMYICLTSHTSGVFATDLAALKWKLIFDLSTLSFGTATAIAVSSHGTNILTNVQTSLNNLEDNKAAATHTHTASQISDSTAAGRNMLTAANVAAQQSLLGLGSLAFLNAVAVTAITNQLAFTGKQTPAIIGSNQNDYAPSGWSTNAVFELSASSAIKITGLSATTDGDLKFIDNVGANNITFTANDISSAAANRFLLPRPHILRPGQTAVFKYDAVNQGWRLNSAIATNPVSGSFKNLMAGNAAGPNFSAPGNPSGQYNLTADALVLEDANGETWRVTGVNVLGDFGVSGAGGLDTGSAAANNSYFLWVIGNPTTNTVAALWSLSATAPTMPSGYTFKGRYSWARTNASNQLQRVLQVGRRAQYVVSASVTTALPILASGVQGSVTTPTWVAISTAAFVPTTASLIRLVVPGVAASSCMVAPNNNYGALTSGSNPPPLASFDTGSATAASVMGEITLESANVYYAGNAAANIVQVMGWEDNI